MLKIKTMKKIIVSLSLFLTGISLNTVNAQLPDGSTASNFTVSAYQPWLSTAGLTNNGSYTLYDYLDLGYTVILDVSATWCGPCWNYHNTGALDDLYAAHGPAGQYGVDANTTNDVMVIWLDGDDATADATMLDGNGTIGNWINPTGNHQVAFPMANPAAAIVNPISTNYAIGYFPTIYKICPNRVLEEIGQATAANLYASIAACPPLASEPVDLAISANKGVSIICGATNYTPSIEIRNDGLDPLTDATVEVSFNGNVVSTGTFSGNLTTYNTAIINCSQIAGFTGGELSYSITLNNDANTANNTLIANVTTAVETTSEILFSLRTDGYASETSWNIKNASNAIVAGTTNPTLANSTQYNFTYNMPSTGCYTVNILDSYGDGIVPSGTVNVRDNNNVVIFNNPDYGDGVSIPFNVTSIALTPVTITSNRPINNGVISVCQGTSVTLTASTSNGNSWSSGQSTQTINVTQTGTYTVTASNGTTQSVQVNINALPVVSYTEADDNACTTDPAIVLSGGMPAGGTYSGVAVSNGQFTPSVFNIGNTTITYSFTDANGCTATSTDVITVTNCSLGVNENITENITIKPNPSNGKFVIEGEKLKAFNTVELVDQVGRTVETWNVTKSTMSIELNDVKNGNYMLIFRGNNEVRNEKIQISK